jgi:hypothetical protein
MTRRFDRDALVAVHPTVIGRSRAELKDARTSWALGADWAV